MGREARAAAAALHRPCDFSPLPAARRRGVHPTPWSLPSATNPCPHCRYPGIDPSDFFNYGMNERTWRDYCARVARFRLEFTMQVGWAVKLYLYRNPVI